MYGTPTYLRSDNGAQFVALSLQGWLARQGIVPLYIDPNCPWQNGKTSDVTEQCGMSASLCNCSVRSWKHGYVWKPFASITIVNVRTGRWPTKHRWRSDKRGMRRKRSSRFPHFDLTRSRGHDIEQKLVEENLAREVVKCWISELLKSGCMIQNILSVTWAEW
jgi:transposase InsO family protein